MTKAESEKLCDEISGDLRTHCWHSFVGEPATKKVRAEMMRRCIERINACFPVPFRPVKVKDNGDGTWTVKSKWIRAYPDKVTEAGIICLVRGKAEEVVRWVLCRLGIHESYEHDGTLVCVWCVQMWEAEKITVRGERL